MEKTDGKPWDRSWSTDEIKEKSGTWTLAGDAALLKHLQQFSQVLLERTHSNEVALNLLLDGMKATAVDISNVTNTFLMLTNTQFVENRVYDDDEHDVKEKILEALPQVKTKEEQAAENATSIKKALTLGISVLDTMFDTVDVPASDSEDEENSESIGRVVLQPRNNYLWQPLPCLIGSKDFIADDTVGLAELLSDNEENVEQNMLPSSSSGTSSDVEHDITEADGSRHHRCVLSSESENSEPESERSVPLGKNNFFEPARTFVEIPEEGTMFGGESPPEAESVSGYLKPTGAADFASELAAKLGGIPVEKTSIAGQETSPGHGISSATTESQDTTAGANCSHIQSETSVAETKKKPVGGVSVLGMVNNTGVKISPYICGPPSTSSGSDTNEEVENQTSSPGISSYSSETSVGVRTVTGPNERKSSFDNDHLHSGAFASHSLFDPDEEDALFLPSSTPKQQKNVASPSDYSDTVQKLGSAIIRPTATSRSLKPNSAAKSSIPVLEGSDSDEDKNLFSSTCSSLSSKSSQSQMSNDFLAKSDQMVPRKDLFQNSSLFGGDYHDEPTFDVFDSTVPEINRSYNSIERNYIISVKGSENIGKTSSALFECDVSDDNVPDVFSNKSSLENSQSKGAIFSFKGITGDKEDDLDNIFSAIKTFSKDNLDLLSTQKLDDDFDIFSSVVATRTKHPSKNSAMNVPKSDETSSQNIESDKKSIGENERHGIVTPATGLMGATELFSSTLKPNLDIDLLFDKDDKTVGEINPSGSEDDSIKSTVVSSSISTADKVNISSHCYKDKTANIDQHKYLLKRDAPRSLSITKTTDLVFKAVPDDGVQEDLENAFITIDGNTKSDSNCESSVRADKISASSVASGFPSATQILQPVADINVASEDKRFGIEKSHTSEGTANLDASPLGRSPSSHININPQLLIRGKQFSPKIMPSETAVSFDSPAGISAVLPSNVKERVRIPTKRRPQSRKARKEALKASSVGFEETDAFGATSVDSEIIFEGIENEFSSGIVLPEGVEDKRVEPSPVLNINNNSPKSEVTNSRVIDADNHTGTKNMFPIHNNDTLPFSPSTDEEDFFGVPGDLPYEYNNGKDSNGYRNEPLFGEAAVLSPIGERKHEQLNHITIDVKPHARAIHNVNISTADNSPQYVVNSTSSQSIHQFLGKLPHKNYELVKNGDQVHASCDSQSSEGDLFLPVDNTVLSENESESDIFQTTSKYKEAKKTGGENVSGNKYLNLASNKTTSKFGYLNTCSNQDKAQSQMTQQSCGTSTPHLFSSVSKDELLQNNVSEVTDLFSADVKQHSSSQLFDEQLFLPKTKNEQMFSSNESSSVLLGKNEKPLHSSSLHSVVAASATVTSPSVDETHSSSAVEETKSLAFEKVKSKKKGSIFLDHNDDDDDDDISIFSSSSQVDVGEKSRSSASPSTNTGSKSHGKIGENASRRKSLSQISKSDTENFEDPLKVTK